jgi:hypothetical protein
VNRYNIKFPYIIKTMTTVLLFSEDMGKERDKILRETINILPPAEMHSASDRACNSNKTGTWTFQTESSYLNSKKLDCSSYTRGYIR